MNIKSIEITCKDVMSHICENLGEELDSARCIEIKKHLEECTNCRSYFKSIEDTISFYKHYNIVLPVEAHKRLLEKLGLEE